MSASSTQESSSGTNKLLTMNNMDDDFISIECLEKLGLEENPFIDHARDPFLYIDEQLEMSINVLIDYLQHQNSTLVLLGEIGIGKTTLLRLLLRKGYQNFNFCTLRAKNNLAYEAIEEKIKQRWSLAQTESIDELTTDEYIKQFIESEKNPVLVIDDAHRLSTRDLDLLLQLKHRVGLQSSSTLGLLLASEPNIQARISELEQSNPAATHVHQTNVRTLDNSQCEKYINYRLKKAGMDDDEFFDVETVNRIYETSLGLPRMVNRLSRIEITHKCQQGPEVNTAAASSFAESKMKQIGIVALGLIGFAALIFAFTQKSDKPDPVIELDIPQDNVNENVVSRPTDNTDNNIEENIIKEDITIEENIIKEDITIEENIIKEDVNIEAPYVAPLVLGKLQLEDDTKESQDIEKPIEKIEKSENQTTENPKKEIIKEAAGKESAAQVATQTLETSKSNQQTNEENNLDNALQDSTTKLHAPNWLLEQPEDAFTIQIVASPSESNLASFNDKHFANQQTAYYKKHRDDKQWYVLVYGIFPTREAAMGVIEAMPEQLKKNKPYPLQLKYIQEVIRN